MLKEGDKVPAGLLRTSFESMVPGRQAGETVALADLTPAGKTLVLFFYPKDSTPGCTREAQGFTASRKAIEKAGGVVVGVSRDSVKSHCSFRDKFGLAIPLLSDPERLLHEGFGAWGEKTMYGKKVLGAIRSTFLIKDGKVVKVWPSVKVDAHVEQVLAALSGSDGAAKAPAKAKAKASAKAKAKAPAKAKAKAKAMSGADDVTVVWVEKAEGRDDALKALGDWGRARGLRVVAASDGAGASAVRIDFAIADRVEKELDRAREAIAALDADVAERALARADAILREHPELPQAAWLRAEVHRGWAARWMRVEPRDDVRAQIAAQDADALDGGRAAGIGEVGFPPRPKTAVTLTVQGGGGRAVVTRLDGVELAGTSTDGTLSYPIDVPPAEHHLVVSLDGETAFSAWVAIAGMPAGAPRPSIPIHLGDDGACSAASFAGVARDGSGVRAASVSCDRWVAAAPAERRGTVLVARCERSTCGPFVEWRSEAGFGGGPDKPPITARGGGWPGWATWTAVGVGAVAATTITLIATGVFESRPTEPRFIAGGARVE